MQNNRKDSKKIVSGLSWNLLENNVSVGHFSSPNSSTAYGPSQIYIKKYGALKIDPQKNVTLFLLHDICQNHERFQSFVDWTRQNNPGVSIVVMDFAGHGLSSGTRGHFEKFEYLVSDFHCLLTQLDKNSDQHEKWIVLGHGLGGMVALDLMNRFQELAEPRIDGLILSNFILKFDSTLLQFLNNQLVGKNSKFEKIIAQLRPLRLFKGSDILTSSGAILSYEQDPLIVHRPTLISIKEIQKKLSTIYQNSYFLDIPLMLMESQSGELVSKQGFSYFTKGIKKELLTEKKYSLMKHDLYNESDNEIVFEDIKNWMNTNEI
jgi:alpha-beta hydrolase superfamily lysophospholipase